MTTKEQYEKFLKLIPIMAKFGFKPDYDCCRVPEEESTCDEDWGMFRVPICDIREVEGGYCDGVTYGEIINKELSDICTEYPEFIWVLECPDCCGCGDW